MVVVLEENTESSILREIRMVSAIVKTVEYSQTRTANIALVAYADNKKKRRPS